MPKDSSNAKSVFDMINSLRDHYGIETPPEEAEEKAEPVEELEETEEIEEAAPAEAASLLEEDREQNVDEVSSDADGSASEEQTVAIEKAEETAAEEPIAEVPDEPVSEVIQEADEPVEEAPLEEVPEAMEQSTEPIEEGSHELPETLEELPEIPEEEPTSEEEAEELAELSEMPETDSQIELDPIEIFEESPVDEAPDETSDKRLEETSEEPIDKTPEELFEEPSEEEPTDEVPEDQLALEMPEAIPDVPPESAEEEAPADEPASPEKAEAETASGEPAKPEAEHAPEAPVAAVQTSVPDASKGRPARRVMTTIGKPIASEQIAMDHLPMMHGDPSKKPLDDTPSVESLERSSPDLSSLPDQERLRKSGLSEEDIRMMLEFGYEDDLRHSLGYRNLRKIKYPGDALEQTRLDLRPYAYTGKEYDGSANSRNEILSVYRKEKTFLLWRLIVVALSTLALLFLDVFAEKLIAAPAHPALLSLCGMAALLVAALFSHRALSYGYKSLVYFAPTPHSIPALFLPIALAVDLLAIFLPVSLPAVNFPVALLLSLSALGDAFRFSTEKRSFLVVSSAETNKIAIDPYIRRKKKKLVEERIRCLIDDTPDHAEYRVRQTERLTGFFRRSGNLAGYTRSFSLTLSLSFGLAAVGGIVAWIFADGILPTLSTGITVLLYAAPLSSVFAFFYPARLVSGELAKKRVAVVGEESISELGEKSTLLFEDSLAFTEKDCSGIPQRKDSDVNQDLRLAGILFRKLGGIPAQIAAPLFPAGDDPAVSIVRIRDDGIDAIVDNRYRLMVGSRNYLVERGIRCPAESKNTTWQSIHTTELFVAIDDVLKLRYSIEYARIDDFDTLLDRLRKAGIDGGVFTYDPALNETFLHNLYGHDLPPDVVKPGAFDGEGTLAITDSPIVALGKEGDLIEPIEAAASIRRARKLGFRIQWITSILGAALATLCSIWVKSPIRGLGALSLFHLAVLIITWAVETAQFKNKQS